MIILGVTAYSFLICYLMVSFPFFLLFAIVFSLIIHKVLLEDRFEIESLSIALVILELHFIDHAGLKLTELHLLLPSKCRY